MTNPYSPQGLYSLFTQAFPPSPSFTEKNVPDQTGKVFFVSGANSGLGKLISRILYSKNAKVYVACRSESKAEDAIREIKASEPSSQGELVFLKLDLADLSTIKGSVQQFLDKEEKLQVLFNNAGVMMPAVEKDTAQGHEMHLGVNDIGPFLLTKLLTPTLVATARTEPAGSVRVVWVGSSAAEAPFVPKGGVIVDEIEKNRQAKPLTRYGISKAGNYLQAAEMAKRLRNDGVISVSLNPGNLDSDLWRDRGKVSRTFLRTFILHNPIKGAYTELYAAFSDRITLEQSGLWVVPWGRSMNVRKDLLAATKSKEEGGTGTASEYWDWSEKQVAAFA